MDKLLFSFVAFSTVWLVVWYVGGTRASKKARTAPITEPLAEGVKEANVRAVMALGGCLTWLVPAFIAGCLAAGLVWRFV